MTVQGNTKMLLSTVEQDHQSTFINFVHLAIRQCYINNCLGWCLIFKIFGHVISYAPAVAISCFASVE